MALTPSSQMQVTSPQPSRNQNAGLSTGQQTRSRIGAEAAQQIQSLLDEKESRTPAQRKIDSQLLYAVKMHRGEGIAAGVRTLAVEVGADDRGRVVVDVTAAVSQQLLKALARMGVEYWGVFPLYHTLRARVALDQLESLADLPGVRFIQRQLDPIPSRSSGPKDLLRGPPAPAVSSSAHGASNVRARLSTLLSAARSPLTAPATGSVTSEGDATHRADEARAAFGADGTGVRVGVLSNGVAHLADSQASGNLGNVTVLPGQEGCGDEGTAMLEIIHDLAPGAQLYFATGFTSPAQFAQNIRDLRAAGCDVIVDDLGYTSETPFQNGQAPNVTSTTDSGLLIQAVNEVTTSGALYFSSAANDGSKDKLTSGTWEGDFVDGGTLNDPPPGFPTAEHVHDFDPSSGEGLFNTITKQSSSGVATPITLFWSDPLGASDNDYDLFVLDSTGTSVVGASTNFQTGTQDAYESVQGVYGGTCPPTSITGANVTGNRIVIGKKTGAADRFLHLATNRGRLNFNTQGATHGHNAISTSSGFYSVAATPAITPGPFPNPFNPANSVETFSSDGPRRIFFNADGSAITPGIFSSSGGQLLQKPDITAADKVSVSGAGGFPKEFSGTSAAAPHAAAIAALLKSLKPSITPGEVRAALTGSAIDIEAAGVDRDSGAGIIDAVGAMRSLQGKVFQVDGAGTLSGGLQAYYKFEDTSHDSFNSNDLTCEHGSLDPCFVGFDLGKIGKGVNSIKGGQATGNNFLFVNSNLNINGAGSDFTFSCWAKMNQPPDSQSTVGTTILSHVDSASRDRKVLAVGLNLDTAHFPLGTYFVATSYHGGLFEAAFPYNAINDGKFHFFVLRHVGSVMEVWADNVNLGSVNGTGAGGATPADQFTVFDVQPSEFRGVVDEVGVWNRALTTGEMTDLYNNGSGQTMITPGPSPTPIPTPTPMDGPGKIAFTSDRDGGDFEIYLMKGDGTNQFNLTHSPGQDAEPSFSKDGSKIAFRSNRDGNFEIYVMNADGTGQTNLTNNPATDVNPSFRPDGSKILFSSTRDGNSEIYVMNADGTNPVNVTNNPASDFRAAFSSDGSKIAFTSDRDGNEEIYVMNADGSNPVRLTTNPGDDSDPAFSPDGQKIAFLSNRNGNNGVYVMNADGSDQTYISNSPATTYKPTFRPDGSKIAFGRLQSGGAEIFVMNPDGTDQTNITNRAGDDLEPTWAAGDIPPTPTPTPSATPTPTPSPTPTPTPSPATVSNVSGSGVYGGTATLTATLTSGGSPLGGKTVSFTLNGAAACGAGGKPACPTTDGGGVASLANVSLAGINAGAYPNGVGASFAGDSDYQAGSASNALTVGKATLTITWNNPADILYGTALGASQLNAASSTPGTFVYTPAAGTVLHAGGGQTLHVAFTPTDAANYNPALKDVSVNVTKATLTVKAEDKSRAYGNANPTLTYSMTGFVNGDTQASATTGQPTITTTADGASATGAYSIMAALGTLAAADYQFTFVNGTLTVMKSDQAINFGALATKTYGDADFSVSVTASSGLAVSFAASGNCTVSESTAHITGAGACTITASQAGNTNYNAATDVRQSFTISKAASATTVSASGATYDGQPHGATAGATGFGGLNQALAVSYQGRNGTNYGPTMAAPTGAGDYTASATFAGDADHAGSSDSKDFQIAKAPTTTALTSSARPSGAGQGVTFTAVVTSGAGAPTGSAQFKDGGVNLGPPVALSAGGVAALTTSGLSAGAHAITADYGGDVNFASSSGSLAGGQLVNTVFDFSQALYTVSESSGSIAVIVKRTGDTSVAMSVDYATDDGSIPTIAVPCSSIIGLALERCDYTRAAGTLQFAAGDSQKSFTVLVNNDSYEEGTETLSLRLSNPAGGAALGTQPSATLQITDGPPASNGNPADDESFYVTQQYHDFLSREPDQSGLDFWTGGITNCGADTHCVEVKRINTSAAFFLSIEFQETGYLVERIYKTAYGDATGQSTFPNPHTLQVPVVRFDEFLLDTQRIGRNVVVSVGNWQEQLEANKQAFALEFVSRPGFQNTGLLADSPPAFVDKLNLNAGGVLKQSDRDQLVAQLAADDTLAARASVLRQVAENTVLRANESNRAFVLMQFFGYLRRNPNDAPDSDYTGYDFWLQKLNQFNGNFVQAEMVKAFITSIEYRRRFGQ
jgi:hypothetical protein